MKIVRQEGTRKKNRAPGEDRTHDLQIALVIWLWDWRAAYCATEATHCRLQNIVFISHLSFVKVVTTCNKVVRLEKTLFIKENLTIKPDVATRTWNFPPLVHAKYTIYRPCSPHRWRFSFLLLLNQVYLCDTRQILLGFYLFDYRYQNNYKKNDK